MSSQTTSPPPSPEGAVEHRPLADRVARKVLRVEDAAPRALMSMRGSLVISALRCVLTYAVIPALATVVSWLGPLAAPLSLALSCVAFGMALRSLRRVWLADWSGRWGYTAFAVVVLVALGFLIVLDTRAVFFAA